MTAFILSPATAAPSADWENHCRMCQLQLIQNQKLLLDREKYEEKVATSKQGTRTSLNTGVWHFSAILNIFVQIKSKQLTLLLSSNCFNDLLQNWFFLYNLLDVTLYSPASFHSPLTFHSWLFFLCHYFLPLCVLKVCMSDSCMSILLIYTLKMMLLKNKKRWILVFCVKMPWWILPFRKNYYRVPTTTLTTIKAASRVSWKCLPQPKPQTAKGF